MTTSTINIYNLPVLDQLYEEDFVLVQAKDRTGLLKFEDFVIGEQQVSFYKEIVASRNAVNTLTQSLATAETNIETSQSNIATLDAKTTGHENTITVLQTSVDSINEAVQSLQNKTVDLDSDILNQSQLTNDALTASQAAVSVNDSLQTGLSGLNQSYVTLTQKVDDLQASINSVNNQLYTINARLVALETP